jgi:ferritin-like metal-binding protein YciE
MIGVISNAPDKLASGLIGFFERSITMELATLQDLFVDELKDIYNAETQITKALPKMAKAAASPDLKKGFEEHLAQTEEHVARLEKIFSELGEKPTGKVCHGMKGLLEEGTELMKEEAEPDVMDAGLISAAQRVEHYEIAAYGTARTYAELLGNKNAAKLLQTTLDEEGATDKKLSALASGINVKANKAA